ncbi:hypothetical protein [Cellulomonas denverensis]|uniref:Hemagglutinin n=1 Tax=Cellulomonas denverensis TaxID=264297 RepID=A0A7X6KUQ4_9CELL|nr:hypothetical protein [Cellulomonas denverensis]NKY22518.1 hypothetical protein [Cellulomonas denverensis]
MSRLLRRSAAAFGALTMAVAMLVSAPTDHAVAADLGQFDPGMIISDSIFYDAGSMSAADIQAFLDTKGANCSPASGNTCLKDYRQATTTRSADSYCKAYAGSGSESAAQIIAKVATACGINPQVLLVTLQKEQGLVTATAGKSAAVYQKALGFGCPDTAACDTQYFGFGNQVYLAARQFQLYAANPSRYSHRAGMTNNVLYHPSAACGSSAVYIQNQATASLYNYTPYQPNKAALAAGYGTGDSCSSYGNRNFWNYFTDWFGSTNQRAPIGSLDQVSAVSAGTVRVRGWAFDPDTADSIRVHVYVDGRATQALTANTSRPDVGAAYGRGSAHGFDATIGMAAGSHQVCVYAIDANGGTNPLLGCSTVAVVNQTPIGSLDAVTATGPGTVQVRGWALDPDTRDPIRVHVYVDGKSVQALTADGVRNDVDRAYGKGPNHGFSTTVSVASGTHEVCTYAIDSNGGGNPRFGCKTVTVNNKTPIGSLDAVTATGPSSIRVRGWALDPDTRDPIRVHVYVDGKSVQALTADGVRNDVDRAHGMGPNHGFDATITVAAGTHEVCTYAIDSNGGGNPRFGCKTVTVVNQTPRGALDSVTGGMEQFTVSGWALDPDTRDPIRVHVYVDGKSVQALTADGVRNDVDRAYGMGPNHGYSAVIAATRGQHEVCVYAIDSSGGGNPRIGCKTVTVNGTAFGALDPLSASSAGIQVRGWAIDPDTTGAIRVHIWVDGAWQAEVRANVSRPDVDNEHHMGPLHGYDTVLARPVNQASGGWSSGSHQVCTYAIDSTGGTNPLIGCASVTVP